MKKIYCDICNREVVDTKEYILPKIETVWGKDKYGNKMMSFDTVNPRHRDICQRCAGLLKIFVDYYLPTLSTADDKYEVHFSLVRKENNGTEVE